MLTTLAQQNPVNRLAAELRAIAWDGVERHLTDYAGAEANDWNAVAGWRWLLGLVRRILVPGAKHDLVMVLVGAQGVKTSVFRDHGADLGRDLFVDIDQLTRDPDIQMHLEGKCVWSCPR